jgi:signal peptidase I
VAEIEPRYRRWVRWALRQLEHCLALIGLGTIVYFSCFDLSRVTSGSMKPTLIGEDVKSGDLVLTERVSAWFRHPRRWEVITCRRADGLQVMKRVVGLPGEKIQMLRGGRIVIDGVEITPPDSLGFLKYFAFGNLCENKPVDCGNGYYVLGDDSRDSDDSRFNGPVRPAEMVGRAWVILAPAGRRRFINP